MQNVLNKRPGMEYRQFGKTNKKISTITLGGMRFKHGWNNPRNFIPPDSLKQCIEVVQQAFTLGINHFESAWDYKKSETLYGKVLNDELKIPRSSYLLMTKSNGKTGDEIKRIIENQLKDLKTDYLDFYAWHGINNDKLLRLACSKNGPVEQLLKLKDEGVIKHVGFSTHAPLQTIIKTIKTGYFEFVNLHYYYFNQRNSAAVEIARLHNLGVFIISPNDKGGQLFKAPQKIKDATYPSTPIQWNARFCLQNQAIHTLSFGITEAAHFQEMKGIFPTSTPISKTDNKIKEKLDSFIHDDPYSWYEGFELENDRSGINIPVILQLRKLWKCYDMLEYGKYRYKVFENKDHWFPGIFPTQKNINQIDFSKVPPGIPLKKLLDETHEALYNIKYTMIKNT